MHLFHPYITYHQTSFIYQMLHVTCQLFFATISFTTKQVAKDHMCTTHSPPSWLQIADG